MLTLHSNFKENAVNLVFRVAVSIGFTGFFSYTFTEKIQLWVKELVCMEIQRRVGEFP